MHSVVHLDAPGWTCGLLAEQEKHAGCVISLFLGAFFENKPWKPNCEWTIPSFVCVHYRPVVSKLKATFKVWFFNIWPLRTISFFASWLQSWFLFQFWRWAQTKHHPTYHPSEGGRVSWSGAAQCVLVFYLLRKNFYPSPFWSTSLSLFISGYVPHSKVGLITNSPVGPVGVNTSLTTGELDLCEMYTLI